MSGRQHVGPPGAKSQKPSRCYWSADATRSSPILPLSFLGLIASKLSRQCQLVNVELSRQRQLVNVTVWILVCWLSVDHSHGVNVKVCASTCQSNLWTPRVCLQLVVSRGQSQSVNTEEPVSSCPCQEPSLSLLPRVCSQYVIVRELISTCESSRRQLCCQCQTVSFDLPMSDSQF